MVNLLMTERFLSCCSVWKGAWASVIWHRYLPLVASLVCTRLSVCSPASRSDQNCDQTVKFVLNIYHNLHDL